ncbi:MAG: SDR family oxidoreductase [Novosphingobium sp.]
MSRVWMITGAGRGLGLVIAKAALAAGHKVVATGRNPEKVAAAVGPSADLLVTKLDVTDASDAITAVQAAIERFGRIDVLINNAASFYAGFFEELTPDQMELQLKINLIGPMNVTRSVLPVMREQRAGQIISISSIAGLTGFEFCTAYCASKFGLEGWMQALHPEVEPFNIRTMVVNLGFFRTDILTDASMEFATPLVEDYHERGEEQRAFWLSMNGQQAGDPTKLAHALVTMSDMEELPHRFIAGEDALAMAEEAFLTLNQEAEAFRDISTSMAID